MGWLKYRAVSAWTPARIVHDEGVVVHALDSSSSPTGPARILLVENDEQMAFLLERNLAALGHRVNVCANPRHALEIFRGTSHMFDLVITDFWMPGLNGVELALELLGLRRLPIILLSGFCEGWTRARVRSLGIHELLHKPIEIEALDHVIRDARRGYTVVGQTTS